MPSFSIAPSFVEVHDKADVEKAPGVARMIAAPSACKRETPAAENRKNARGRSRGTPSRRDDP